MNYIGITMSLINKTTINVYLSPNTGETLVYLKSINQKLNKIMAEQNELAEQLVALSAQIDKIGAEIVAKVQALEEALEAADDVTPEVQAAFDELKAKVQSLDELNPDATTSTTTETTEEV